MAPNDECHFHYRVISINNTYAATLDSANSISTRFDVGFDTIADGSARPVTFDPDGTQRIVIAHTIVNVPTKIEVRRLQENGSGDIATETGQTVVTINDSAIPTGLVNMGLAWDSVNGDVYGFWRGTDSDLFYDKSADGDDANWTTDVEQEDAVTINGVWANYYNETIGYVVLDVTTLKYGELDLSTAAVTRLPFARRQLTTVRM